MPAVILIRPNLADGTNAAYLRADHDARVQADEELVGDLEKTPGVTVTGDGAAKEGTKGVAGDLALVLGTPGVIAGAVRVFHLWLSRDRRRSLTLVVRDADGGQTEFCVEGEAISEKAIHAAIEAALAARPTSAADEPV